MEDSFGSIAAPYGRSCVVCVRAKCKCFYRTGQARCERCNRLNKECRPTDTKRRRLDSRKNDEISDDTPDDSSRTARLEEKLDQVLASLKPREGPITPASDASSASFSSHFSVANPPAEPGINRYSGELLVNYAEKGAAAASNGFPQEFGPPPFAAARADRVWKLAGLSVTEAEENLAEFRTRFSPWFPAIHLPPDMTAEQLRLHRPFLWLNIVLLASHSSVKQRSLGEVVRREIAQAMVMDSEKSLDLLLGLLVFMGWYHLHCQCDDGSVKLSLALLTQMALSLVFDLQLNRQELRLPVHQTLGVTTHKYAGLAYPRTKEAKRAAVGAFLLVSMLSFYLQRIDSLRWTPYFGDILRELKESPEWDGDTVLAHQVQLQLIVERAVAMSHYDAALGSEHTTLPSSAFVDIFHTQLEAAKNSIPAGVWAKEAVQLHYLINRINILDLAPLGAHAGTVDPARTKRRWSTYQTAKTWLDVFFTLSPTTYRGFSFTVTTQKVHFLGALIELATLDEPGWDKDLFRSHVDVVELLDRMTEKFAQAAPLLSTGSGDNTFSFFCKFFQAARASLVQRLNRVDGEPPVNELTAAADSTGFPGMFDLDFIDNELFWNFPTGQDVTI
ncbi:uncharacterized protein LTR77_003845 [Saxophila tyrrhenica]|uniref:Zn(2)-C6 fungal-type domain-containing protein n=1 Tax=Saxophila tyrrhenica TaxID=1690608 RepID=A0AAV9PGC8_9PEZI|nr:hypothetical protein LTR77_003845 [Saxophila tyrrhenica]